MIKMPETTIREEITKFRFIIPLFQFILLLLSTIDIIVNLYACARKVEDAARIFAEYVEESQQG